jgi:NhaC family Na+:H+ antiporter
VEAVDNLLTKGGFESMMYTVSLVICAMMFGGIMEKTNQLRVVVTVILKKAQSTGSLITATILTAIGSNLILCDQYMSIVMTGKMYAQSYKDKGLHPKNLSRAIEDSATVTANLVPWNSGGAYQAATLGVPTIAYLPFNFFCWIRRLFPCSTGGSISPSIPWKKRTKYPRRPNKVPLNRPATAFTSVSRRVAGAKEIRRYANISA